MPLPRTAAASIWIGPSERDARPLDRDRLPPPGTLAAVGLVTMLTPCDLSRWLVRSVSARQRGNAGKRQHPADPSHARPSCAIETSLIGLMWPPLRGTHCGSGDGCGDEDPTLHLVSFPDGCVAAPLARCRRARCNDLPHRVLLAAAQHGQGPPAVRAQADRGPCPLGSTR